MTPPAPAWYWSDVQASIADDAAVHLAHRHADASIVVRNGRLIRGAGYAEAPSAVRHDLARVGAIVRLRQRGRYFVHAAGAVDRQGGAWLLSGDSGSGKSTLGYALARAGWSSLGDDGVVIEPRERAIMAHGWRDPLRVSSTLSSAFPELGAHADHASRRDARRRIPMPMPLSQGAPVAAIVFVARAERFALTRLGPVVTLGHLIRQSPWVVVDDDHRHEHLEALKHTSATVPAFRLEHTPAELHTIADVLAGALA